MFYNGTSTKLVDDRNGKRNKKLTFLSGLAEARDLARRAVNVLFPTPPLPDNTRILCFTVDSRAFTISAPTTFLQLLEYINNNSTE
jgi:hypothetical protein